MNTTSKRSNSMKIREVTKPRLNNMKLVPPKDWTIEDEKSSVKSY